MADVQSAIGATARIFWLYLGLALAAALLAFLPDRSAIYTDAIRELRRLETIDIKADEVDAALSQPAFTAIGHGEFDAIGKAASAEHLAISKGLAGNSTYFLVDQGPQSLSFQQTSVADLIPTLTSYAEDPHYVIVAPKPNSLKAELQENLNGLQGVITSFDIPCNYKPDRCQADVYVNPNGDVVSAQRDLEFFVPRVSVSLPFGVKDLVEARYPALKDTWLEVSALQRVQDDVGELSAAAAVAKLQELRTAEDRPLSIFDVSLSGATARVAAPVALAVLALAALASVRGLARLRLDRDDIDRALFLPLIENRPAMLVRFAAFAFPLAVSEGLLVRSWRIGLAPWSLTLGALLLQAVATLALFRSMAELRGVGERPARTRMLQGAALVSVSVIACVSLSLASPRQPREIPPPPSKAAIATPSKSSAATPNMPSETEVAAPPNLDTLDSE